MMSSGSARELHSLTAGCSPSPTASPRPATYTSSPLQTPTASRATRPAISVISASINSSSRNYFSSMAAYPSTLLNSCQRLPAPSLLCKTTTWSRTHALSSISGCACTRTTERASTRRLSAPNWCANSSATATSPPSPFTSTSSWATWPWPKGMCMRQKRTI